MNPLAAFASSTLSNQASRWKRDLRRKRRLAVGPTHAITAVNIPSTQKRRLIVIWKTLQEWGWVGHEASFGAGQTQADQNQKNVLKTYKKDQSIKTVTACCTVSRSPRTLGSVKMLSWIACNRKYQKSLDFCIYNLLTWFLCTSHCWKIKVCNGKLESWRHSSESWSAGAASSHKLSEDESKENMQGVESQKHCEEAVR